MTEGQKQALIGLCKIEIKRWKAASESDPNMRYMVELMGVALSALTAEPVADVVSWNHPVENRTCAVQLRRFDLLPGELFTAPPAPAADLAELVPVPPEFLSAEQNSQGMFELSEDCMTRLAIALSQQAKGLVIKPGHALVPVEPSWEMISAAIKSHEGDAFLPVSLYKSMLAAAPEVE